MLFICGFSAFVQSRILIMKNYSLVFAENVTVMVCPKPSRPHSDNSLQVKRAGTVGYEI
jgi:hypothetical protein